MRTLLFALGLLIASHTAWAADESQIAPSAEPKITIHEGKNQTVYEYSINGFIYAIKVVPKDAPTYYLVAADGKGNFTRTDDPSMLIPSWKIFTW